jgi:peptide/nickel transport system substrate-binding protein
MSRTPRLAAVVAVIATVLILAACGSVQKPPNASGSASASGGSSSSAAANSTFTYDTYTQVMVGWDPSTAYSNEIIAMHQMYETLTYYNTQSQKLQPLLATSWSRSADGKTWTFHLRPNVRFHTGRTMTSADVKASIQRTIKLNGGAAYIWGSVKTIATPNPLTVVFHLSYPAPLDLISSAGYAAYIFDTKAAGSPGALTSWFNAGHEAGTGPYTVQSWQKGAENELRLKAFSGYWGGWSGRHYQRVVFRVVPTDSTAAQLLQGGQVSWVEQLTPQLWKSLQGQSGIRTTSSASYQNLFAMLNTASGPLKDVRLRQALADATDYSGIIAALQGSFVGAHGIIPSGLWGYSASLQSATTNAPKAKQLLAAAGYGPGKKPLNLTLTYTQGDTDEQTITSLLRSEWGALNVNLNVQALQWPTQWAKGKSSNTSSRQDILLFYWWPDYADPYSWFINLFHSATPVSYNLAYYDNPSVNGMIDKVESVAATSRAKATSMYVQIENQLIHDTPALFLGTQVYQRAYSASVGNYVDNPAYPNVVFAYNLTPQ